MSSQSPHAGRVAGKVAIVTGATSGIGRATAVLLAREGASVVAAGRREELGAELVEQLTAEGLSIHYIRTDVSKREDVERLVRGAVARFGRLDIVVNDAAMFLHRGVEDCTEDEWDQIIDTNLKSVYLVCHDAIPHLRAAGGGAIVNVSSVHAYATMERMAAYAASKGGIVALSRQMALDYTRDRIRVNALIVRALMNYYTYFGDDFKVECPTGSGRLMTLYQVAEEISRRLANIFLKGKDGHRPVYGGSKKFQEDPHWRDLILFYEYFHGDNGAGLGASHQTGWTGVVARLMHLFATTTPEQVLQIGMKAAVVEVQKSRSGQLAAVGGSGQ